MRRLHFSPPMRHAVRCCSGKPHWAVGPTVAGAAAGTSAKGSDRGFGAGAATPAPPVEFGSVRRRAARAQERRLRNKEALEALAHMQRIVDHPSAEDEASARELLERSYGFVRKPPTCLFFRQFLSELRRYEMQWASTNANATVLGMIIRDHGIDGKGAETVTLCHLRSAQERADSVSDWHQAMHDLLYTTGPTSIDIMFIDEFFFRHKITLSSVYPLSFSEAAEGLQLPDDIAALERELSEPFMVVPGGPYRRYMQRINATITNLQSGETKQLWQDLTVQAAIYMFLSSVVRFLKANELGKPNITLVRKDDLEHLRYSFVNLRQQIGMLPINDLELNTMLPAH